MDIWMNVFNTTTQSLTGLLSQSLPDENTKLYLKGKFNELIGSVKLFSALDQGMGFIDNNFIDSGLLRGLFRYGNDPEVRILRDETRKTLFDSAEKIIYVHDNRIEGKSPESLIKERFNLTRKAKMIPSASFGDEKRWEEITSYDDAISKIPEVKHMFRFLIELLERIPKENIVKSPQNAKSFGNMLEFIYKDESAFLNQEVSYKINRYLDEQSDPAKRDRSDFYKYAEKNFTHEEQAILHNLFTDRIYNQIVPWESRSMYRFEDWGGFTALDQGKISLIYNLDKLGDETETAMETLFRKGKMFNFLARQNPTTIKSIRAKVRQWELTDPDDRPENFGKEILWDLYNSNDGDSLNKAYTNSGLNLIENIAQTFDKSKMLGVVVPKLHKINEIVKPIKFFYLTKRNEEFKATIELINNALSGRKK